MSGTAGSISIPGVDAEFVLLCDDIGTARTPFLRRYSTSAAGTVTSTDTGLDGATPYTVAGTVTVCATAAEPVELAVHGAQDTAWSLADQPGTVSVTVVVYTGSVSVGTGDGTLTLPAGASLTWSAEDEPSGTLTGLLDVTGAAGASWQVIWTARP
ncbi:hypothetical protein [Streptomyces althioticus]|uniref:hypothetical protein n=1 Tax=Streptomyces althioticus TaxID=83380 RepID=UPI00367EB425